MSDVTTAKRALARLAGDAEPPAATPRAVIDTATAAVERVELAAAFADIVGVPRLERAVRTASERDDRDLERRGQRALAEFERFRAAADGGVSREDRR